MGDPEVLEVPLNPGEELGDGGQPGKGVGGEG